MGADLEAMRKHLAFPFPPEALKQRQGGGGSRFTYVEGFAVIRRLNEATGGAWDWTIKSFEFRPLPPLTDRKTGELKEQSLVVVTGELTIPGLGTRAGVGVQKVSESGGEDLVKGASTDALKKAATLFGVALDLYGPDYEAAAPAAPEPAAVALTDAQERVIAQAWEMAEAKDTYGATKALVLTLKPGASDAEWKEINRRCYAVRVAHYPSTVKAAQQAAG